MMRASSARIRAMASMQSKEIGTNSTLTASDASLARVKRHPSSASDATNGQKLELVAFRVSVRPLPRPNRTRLAGLRPCTWVTLRATSIALREASLHALRLPYSLSLIGFFDLGNSERISHSIDLSQAVRKTVLEDVMTLNQSLRFPRA